MYGGVNKVAFHGRDWKRRITSSEPRTHQKVWLCLGGTYSKRRSKYLCLAVSPGERFDFGDPYDHGFSIPELNENALDHAGGEICL